MIAGDINGDGLANDRAFIPASGEGDSGIRDQLSALLSSAPQLVRNCLTEQRGQIAAANSCRGPWQTRLDINIDFVPPRGVGLGNRLHITTKLINVGAALERGLGLGAGTTMGAFPDQRLLYITGFDPATESFRYRVNQLFGQPIGTSMTNHFPPFQLQLGAEYRFSEAPQNPVVKEMGLTQTGDSATMARHVLDAFHRISKNPIDTILAFRDSLELDKTQVALLRGDREEYESQVAALSAPLVPLILQQGKRLTDDNLTYVLIRLLSSIEPARTATRNRAIARLNPAQLLKLDALLASDRSGHN